MRGLLRQQEVPAPRSETCSSGSEMSGGSVLWPPARGQVGGCQLLHHGCMSDTRILGLTETPHAFSSDQGDYDPQGCLG